MAFSATYINYFSNILFEIKIYHKAKESLFRTICLNSLFELYFFLILWCSKFRISRLTIWILIVNLQDEIILFCFLYRFAADARQGGLSVSFVNI